MKWTPKFFIKLMQRNLSKSGWCCAVLEYLGMSE